MQHAFIVTSVASFTTEFEGQLLHLNLLDHVGRSIIVQGTSEQQVNIQTLRSQMLPMVILADQLAPSESVTIPANALVSVVPVAAVSVQAMLDAGKADEIISSIFA